MDAESAYDVFISYRQLEPDKGWVRGALLPKLIEGGLKVFVDFKHFRPGASVLIEMERGVVESRYTLAVVTPKYLESTFTDFENVLSQHLGLEKSQRRLIVLIREPCELSLRLRHKLCVEMKTDKEFNEGLPRLLETLKQSADI